MNVHENLGEDPASLIVKAPVYYAFPLVPAILPRLPPEQLSLVCALERREADARRWEEALVFLRSLPHRPLHLKPLSSLEFSRRHLECKLPG